MWNAFQVVFVYLMLPGTSGRTLEELTLCECPKTLLETYRHPTIAPSMMFEGDHLKKGSGVARLSDCMHEGKLELTVPRGVIVEELALASRDTKLTVCLMSLALCA